MEAAWTIDYAPTTIAGGEIALLPQSAEFRMTQQSGESSHNLIGFTMPDLPFGKQPSFRPLPPGVDITVKLTTRLTPDLAVGALIEGVVIDQPVPAP